ncbi:MAG: protein-export membrane protein SecD [Candidatus Niyogibacteria bacterium RIFCSPLOWO2_01_FULL_45_48]|uniref:Protein translocase subunit SecD n=2 Tax=Candidatus Niyogiibacteriota TaxID=1817912 RepID=A0A1G2EYU6_9BACT|nr:MAG: protein-export membrane protein SecD [Candidatus Niyogibacteria bacterium RIFCSPHIGHO2_01_FULL_45_28]OGZ30536.1 MAG: protein-export membrane protein SecD [Candidatus Niyogibacteria bacterium RIFCSPLOWO2_01_FULL_45_48]OGZ30560.1 MAG: protein-export membrane protein SecD [Candidatus Niyogibacteria bacterium RIFCSPLOWO2_02_FULL_45_13]
MQTMLKIRLIAISLLLAGVFLAYFAGANFFRPGWFLGNIGYRLGLDLQGGAHLVYEADVSSIAFGEVSESMEGLRDVIERRVNAFGVTEPVVQVQKSGDSNRLIVELAGVFDTDQAIQTIGQTPYLEFKTERAESERDKILSAQENDEFILEDPYFVSSELTGRFLKRSVLNFDSTTNEPVVLLEFNDEGAEIFGKITKDNIGKRVAIYLDGFPISAPVVQSEITSGSAQITGQFTPDEARTLVRRLNSGALPVPIKLIAQQSVGASLGGESLARGLVAGIYGVLAVALFLILRYRLPGLIAVFGLAFYVVLILSVFKILPVTLTAAGIAGFLLSVGMAVDANILIFERMREETRWGADLEDAVETGFKRAWPSIRDSNISTLITSTILYWFGTSIIRGFALTLGVGVLASIFSALVVTKVFVFAFGLRNSMFSFILYGVKRH